MTEFPFRNWNKQALNRLIKSIDASESSDREALCGQPRSARRANNIARVAGLFCSQDDDPGTSEKVLARFRGSIARRTVKKNLNLKKFRHHEVQQLPNADSNSWRANCIFIRLIMANIFSSSQLRC